MSIFSFINNKLAYLFRRLRWYLDYKAERRNISALEGEINLSDSNKLILLPHVDDEWIGCSQVLVRYPNSIICDMDMLGGDSIEIHVKRKKELAEVAKYLNRKLVTITTDKSNRLKDIIEELNCFEIFLPFFIDWHSEHLEVIDIVEEALRGLSRNINVVMYQISVPMRKHNVNFALPLTEKDCKEKWSLFEKFYPTQLHLPTLRFMLQERINGAYANSYAAEVFCLMERDHWLKEKNKYSLKDNYKRQLSDSLNNINLSRSIVEQFTID